MTTVPAPMCLECARYRPAEVDVDAKCVKPASCDAFPDGIPDAILDSEVDHRKPYEGDGGQTFVPMYPDEVGEFTGNPYLMEGKT